MKEVKGVEDRLRQQRTGKAFLRVWNQIVEILLFQLDDKYIYAVMLGRALFAKTKNIQM